MTVGNYTFVSLADIALRFSDLKEQHERLSRQQSPPAEMDAGMMEDLISSGQEVYIQDPSENSNAVLLDSGEAEKEEDSERSRNIDETSHKNRSKRERADE